MEKMTFIQNKGKEGKQRSSKSASSGSKRGKASGYGEVTQSQALSVSGPRSFKVEDILRVGKAAFFNKVSPKKPLPIPDLGFTEEENQRLNEMLAAEKES